MGHKKIIKDYEDGVGQQYWSPEMGTCSVKSGSCSLIGQKYGLEQGHLWHGVLWD